MKKLFAPVISLVVFLFLIFILSSFIPALANFLAWWFITKEEINAPITTGQAVIIDLITHAITYVSVFIIFATLDWWNSKAMHYIYVVISEVVALGLAILMRFIIDYYWIIFIIIGVVIVASIIITVIIRTQKKKKEEVPTNA